MSTFVQTPTKVIAHLDEGDVVLTRREGDDLRLSLDKNVERDAISFAHAAEVVSLLSRHDDAVRIRTLLAVFPWMEILSASEQAAFADEYFATLRASAALRTFIPLETVENAWKSTAELRADPDLRARIRSRLETESPRPLSRPGQSGRRSTARSSA